MGVSVSKGRAVAAWWRSGWNNVAFRLRTLGQHGYSLIELLMTIIIAGIITVAVLLVLEGTTNVFNSEEVRMLDQDDARTAINQMARYIRMATSSADNGTTLSNAIATALPQNIEFYCDVDGDGIAEKVRYYLASNILRSQSEDPTWVTGSSPGWSYGAYSTNGVVIEDKVRNDTQPVFIYYRYVGTSGSLEAFTPSSDADRRDIVAVGLYVQVGERPDLAGKDVVLSTEVQIRQRFKGGLTND